MGPDPSGDKIQGKTEEAGLITVIQMIDPVESGWSFAHHVYGFADGDETPSRPLTSPGTMSRCSRQPLAIIHETQTHV